MSFEKSSLTTIKRLPKRGVFNKKEIYATLDEAIFCHVGFITTKNGTTEQIPIVIPTLFGRENDTLYIHGSSSSHMLKSIAKNDNLFSMCVTVSLVDGLVLAKSAFHHSCNYRVKYTICVLLFGWPQHLIDTQQKKRNIFLQTYFCYFY